MALSEVADFQRGSTVTQKEADEGVYPVIAGGQKPAYFIDKYNRDGETVTVAGSGAYAGYVMYWNEPIFVSDAFSVKAKQGVSTRYIYHSLLHIQNKIYDLKRGGGVPHVYAKSVAKLSIPVPPLEIQQAIVEALDKFTALQEALEIELQARRKQFEYYRDELFSFEGDEKVKWLPIGEVGTFIRGKRFTKADYVDDGVGVIHYGEIYTHYGTSADSVMSYVRKELEPKLRFAKPGDVVITDVGETVDDVGKAVAWVGNKEVAIHDHCYAFRSMMNPKFVSYYMQTSRFRFDKSKYIARTKVNTLLINGLAKVYIPVPPMAEQNRIVSILDNFDMLVHSTSVGLPAEISARRKQYEYYRDKLLTFQGLAA